MKLKIKPLFPFFIKFWKAYLLLMVGGALISFLDLSLLLRAKSFLDQGVWQQETVLFLKASCLLLGLFLLLEGLRFWQHFEGDLVTKRLTQRLQDALVERISAAPMSTFVSQRRGDLFQRVMKDVDEVSLFSGQFLASFLRDPLRALFFAVLLFLASPIFGVLAFLCGGMVLLLTKIYQRKVKQVFEKLQQNEGSLFQWFETLLHYFPFLKAYNSSHLITSKWSQCNEKVIGLNLKATKLLLGHRFLNLSFLLILMGILFFAAIQDWGLFSNSPGTVATIAVSTFLCFSGLRNAALNWAGLTDQWVRAQKIAEILSWRPEAATAKNGKRLRETLNEVHIENLSFGYLPGKKILRKINWRLEQGMAVSLTGANGSGKSTLAYLLLRLFDPQQGKICFNQMDFSQLDLMALRRHVGLIFQEPFLLNGSLKENLLYNVAPVTFEKQQEAMRLVGLESLAKSDQALDSFQVGHKGLGLSYGERQRLALGRALLANPDFLILDEATSALDPDSEQQILTDLLKRREDKITLLISHRLRKGMLPLKRYHLKNGELFQSET